jgi:RHS repeat-associated protein
MKSMFATASARPSNAWAFVCALLLAVSPTIYAADTTAASRTDWQYIEASHSPPRCFNDEMAAVTSMLTPPAGCPGIFEGWTSDWPNGTSIKDPPGYDICRPSAVLSSDGNGYKMHGEYRSFNFDTATGTTCIYSPGGNAKISRQFYYYCPDYPTHRIAFSAQNQDVPYCSLSSTVVSPEKTPRQTCPPQSGCTTESNPINVSLGLKFQIETDLKGPGPSSLRFERYYNSFGAAQGTALGAPWRHTYERSISYLALIASAGNSSPLTVHVNRPDGRIISFNNIQGTFASDADVSSTLARLTVGGSFSGWLFTDEEDQQETYDTSGRLQSIRTRSGLTQTLSYDGSGLLQSVTDDFGHSLTFAYNANGSLHTLTDPAGGVFIYNYDSNGQLSTVTAPDNSVRQYLYNEPAYTSGTNLPNALTGIVDENGQRFATYSYDAAGRAIGSQHAGGADAITVTYNTNGTSTVNDALGASRTYTFSLLFNVLHTTGISGQLCVSCGQDPVYTYNGSAHLQSRRNSLGMTTSYSWSTDGRNLPTVVSQGGPTITSRTTTTTWHATYRLPTKIVEPTRTTDNTYDSSGNLQTKTVTDTSVSPNVLRTSTYTYDGYGRVLTADGPRTDASDVTTFEYYICTTGYACGQVHTVTNAAGHITTYNTYNAFGQPLTITDPNGTVTTLAYDARQRLISRQTGGETTTFDYWPTGLLKKVTLPDSSYVLYTYDPAHRLTQVSDGLGNSIDYTLDAMGNHTSEYVYDPSSILHRTHTRIFNVLNQLYQDINAAGTAAVTTTYGYDANSNQTSIAAPLSRNTSNYYDELNRLTRIVDPASGWTQFRYDTSDNLTTVIDPRSLTTSYTYTGFGDLKTQVSPDTGTTTNTYDSGGNLFTSTDARGAISTYSYDALNRMTSVSYSLSGSTDQTISLTYDTGTNGKGHLTGASDASHSLSWSYDALGRVTNKTQTVGSVTQSVGYGYTSGNLTSLTTPSGQSVTYGYNANHQVTSIAVNGTSVLSGVTYEPLGPLNGWTWGNGTTTTRTFDTDGKITQIVSAGTKTYTYDDAFRITGISDTSAGSANWTYGYDSLDRITSGTSPSVTRGWTYDGNGNRRTETGSSPSTYTISPTSNRISGITGALVRTYGYDAAGNTTSYASATATYNNAGRLKTLTQGGTTETLIYNALGQRIEKTGGSAGTVLYAYDEAGHLLGEYDGTGALIEETVWLGDIPVATLRPNGASVSIYYVHTDQLNTPRQVTRPSDNVQMWTWFSDPFGTDATNANPAGAGAFTYNLRFPGQIFDGQAGLHYNYFRDFDPAIGRYAESDPVGLESGIDTYLYVDANPISFVDPYGMWKVKGPQVPDPNTVNPLLYVFLNCVQRCYGSAWELIVTATTNDHTSGAHVRGRAVDLRLPEGAIGADNAVCCSLSCGARYVQDEYSYPSANATAGHIHAQLDRGRGGATGTGRHPRPKCHTCNNPSSYKDAL